MNSRPNTAALHYDAVMLALCIWREARGEDYPTKLGVGCVVRNRAALAPAEGFLPTIAGNVTKPFAFSAFNAGDPNATKWPAAADPAWLDSCAAADEVLTVGSADVTGGAVFYFSPPLALRPLGWGEVEPTVKIGRLNFFKLAKVSK